MQTQELAPDLILHNGRFYTLDPANSVVDAVAIKDGRFLATGAAAAILPLAGAHTQVIDLQGRTVLPGIFDSHNHLQQVGVKLTRVRLDECTSPEEMMELVRARAKTPRPATGSSARAGASTTSPTAACPPAGTSTPPPTSTRSSSCASSTWTWSTASRCAWPASPATRPTRRTGRSAGTPAASPTASCAPTPSSSCGACCPLPTVDELKDGHPPGLPGDESLGHHQRGGPGPLPARDLRLPGLLPGLAGRPPAHRLVAPSPGRPTVTGTRHRPPLTVRVNLMPSWHGFREEETEAELERAPGAWGCAPAWATNGCASAA